MKTVGEPDKICFNHAHDTLGALVNEAPYAVRIDEVTWPTVAHFLLSEQFPMAAEVGIRQTNSVEKAWDLIEAEGFALRTKWDAMKDDFLYRALTAKFTQHLDLEKLLMGTEDRDLVFADREDSYYGIGPYGSGHNMLGRTLMRVRRNLVRLRLDFLWGKGSANYVDRIEEAVANDRSDVSSLSALANTYYTVGWLELAIVAARQALRLSKEHEEWNYRVLVLSLAALGRHDETIEPIRRLTRIDPNDSDYYHWMAVALANLGKEIPAKVFALRARLLNQAKKDSSETESGAC